MRYAPWLALAGLALLGWGAYRRRAPAADPQAAAETLAQLRAALDEAQMLLQRRPARRLPRRLTLQLDALQRQAHAMLAELRRTHRSA